DGGERGGQGDAYGGGDGGADGRYVAQPVQQVHDRVEPDQRALGQPGRRGPDLVQQPVDRGGQRHRVLVGAGGPPPPGSGRRARAVPVPQGVRPAERAGVGRTAGAGGGEGAGGVQAGHDQGPEAADHAEQVQAQTAQAEQAADQVRGGGQIPTDSHGCP